MNAHILLVLLNELRKGFKQGLPIILLLFNKVSDTGARMLENIKINLKSHFGMKTLRFDIMFATFLWTSFNSVTK